MFIMCYSMHSSFAIILKNKRKLVSLLLLSYKRKLVSLLLLSYGCIVSIVLWLFLTVPWAGL